MNCCLPTVREITYTTAHAYNELALQSYEGVIRVYPSLQSAQYCGAFTLKAAGGFMVSGAYSEKGVVPYIIIKSLLGNVCVVEVPFANVNLSDLDGTKIETKEDEYGYMTFATQPGRTYIIWSDDLTREDIPYMNIRMYTNNDWHYYKNARIGSKRQFLTSKRKRGF